MNLAKIIKLLTDRDTRFKVLGSRGFYKWMSDEKYLKRRYKARMGKELDLENPQTFNEKLQWLKLYDRKDTYTTMVDKYEAKKYVSSIIGEKYIIPTLGVWERFDEIDFDSLPEQFVLKTTHDSGGIVICTDKSKFDFAKAKKKLEKSLRHNYYWNDREWPYKNVKPRILAEQFMTDASGNGIKDYKFFCFDGIAKAMYIASDRQRKDEETKFDFYDMDFNHLPFVNGHPNSDVEITRPIAFEKMKQLSEQLSQGIKHIRVDFYDIDGDVYFSELTFSHFAGVVPFYPEEWDYRFGEWINLNQICDES